MRRAVHTALVVLAVLGLAAAFSACGESAPDEFVGTWRQSDGGSRLSLPLVITKTDGGYRGTLLYPNAQPQFDLERDGDRLEGQTSSNRGPADVELTIDSQTGHLVWRGEVYPDSPVLETEFVRVSTSTAIATPSAR